MRRCVGFVVAGLRASSFPDGPNLAAPGASENESPLSGCNSFSAWPISASENPADPSFDIRSCADMLPAITSASVDSFKSFCFRSSSRSLPLRNAVTPDDMPRPRSPQPWAMGDQSTL